MPGTVDDTYIAALQHGLADIPENAAKLGVVRRPTPWFHSQVDDNLPELGPPEELLDEFKNRYEDLQEQGMADIEAHNAALDDINYDDRYRAYLNLSDEAQQAINQIRDRLEQRENVVLVCYENTEYKRCHRTLLKDWIQSTD